MSHVGEHNHSSYERSSKVCRSIEREVIERLYADERPMGLIRVGGHLLKGGYDVQTDGRHCKAPAPPAVR
jgi:hypothetical protein